MAVTTFEKGIEQGIEQGIERGIHRALERQRKTAVVMIQKRFHSIPDNLPARLEKLTLEALNDLCERIIDATTIEDLRIPA